MIIESIVNLFFDFSFSLFSLPDVNMDLIRESFVYVQGLLRTASILLPMDAIKLIFSVEVGILAYKIFIKLFKTLWDIIPVV